MPSCLRHALMLRLRMLARRVLWELTVRLCPRSQAMMRLLYTAIFLGTVSCITEFILKFLKVRESRRHVAEWHNAVVCCWLSLL